MASRLKELYQSDITSSMTEHFSYSNRMQVPQLEKIVVNMGVGEAVQDPKQLDGAVADMTAVSWAELAKLDYLAFGLDSGIGRQLAVPQQRLRWSYEVQHLGSMLALIQSGFGIGVVPYSAIHGHPSLTFRPMADQKLSRTIGLVRRRVTTLSPAAESLRKLAVEVIVEAYEELPGATVMSLSG